MVTEILEVNVFAFAYRLLHEDFSPLDGTHGHKQDPWSQTQQ